MKFFLLITFILIFIPLNIIKADVINKKEFLQNNLDKNQTLPKEFLGEYSDKVPKRYMQINQNNTIHYFIRKFDDNEKQSDKVFQKSKFKILQIINKYNIIILEYDIQHSDLGESSAIISRLVLSPQNKTKKPNRLFFVSGIEIENISNHNKIKQSLDHILEKNNYYQNKINPIWKDQVLISMWPYSKEN